MSRTIIAQCTPIGNGSVALIRLSGENAFIIADKISKLASNKTLSEQKANTIHYGQVLNNQNNITEIIDNVMFSIMRAPKSFTGENTIEITCHNNQIIINNIIKTCLNNGAELAQRGEFSQQAFINKKIDLIQAEAINELILSNNSLAIKKSLSQLDGSFSSWLNILEQKLIKCLTLCEASFEFLDEEDIEFNQEIKAIILNINLEIEKLLKTFNQQESLKSGIRVAIIGPPNAGKSSLFNKFLNKNRAIVTNTPGTTRDTIEASKFLNDYAVTFIDTAGIRETNNNIEQAGIKRSSEEIVNADIVLLVLDLNNNLNSKDLKYYLDILKNNKNKTLLILNKLDLDINLDLNILSDNKNINLNNIIKISVNKNLNINTLDNKINNILNNKLSDSNSTPFLVNQRHYLILDSLKNQVQNIIKILNQNKEFIDYEILALDLNNCLQTLSEFTGKTITEKTLDNIFKEFCVGK